MFQVLILYPLPPGNYDLITTEQCASQQKLQQMATRLDNVCRLLRTCPKNHLDERPAQTIIERLYALYLLEKTGPEKLGPDAGPKPKGTHSQKSTQKGQCNRQAKISNATVSIHDATNAKIGFNPKPKPSSFCFSSTWLSLRTRRKEHLNLLPPVWQHPSYPSCHLLRPAAPRRPRQVRTVADAPRAASSSSRSARVHVGHS